MVTGIGSPVANKLVPGFVPVTSKGTVAFSAHSYEIGTSATITVGDLDLAGNPSCPVTLTSSAGDSETINLPALGGGVFKGSILISGDSVTAGDGILETVPGGTITVTYDDANDGTGHPAVVTDQATTYKVGYYTFTTIGAETAGVPFSVTATAYDTASNPIPSYNGTVALTASGAAARCRSTQRRSRLPPACGRATSPSTRSIRAWWCGWTTEMGPWARATCLRRSPVR